MSHSWSHAAGTPAGLCPFPDRDHFRLMEAPGKSEELESGKLSMRLRSPGSPILPSTRQTCAALGSGLGLSDSAWLKMPRMGEASDCSSAVLAQLLLLASPPLRQVTECQPWAWRRDDIVAHYLPTWGQLLTQHSVSPQPPTRASVPVHQ